MQKHCLWLCLVTPRAIPSPKENLISNRNGTRGRWKVYIGLQNHSDKDVVFFKEVAMKRLQK